MRKASRSGRISSLLECVTNVLALGSNTRDNFESMYRQAVGATLSLTDLMTASAAISAHPRLGERTVVVIGGGIGGLALALALQQDGANVQVYERDEGFEDRKQGYGLTLTCNEQGPLAKLGILETVKARDEEQSPSRRHFIFAPDGTILGYYGNDFAPATVVRPQRGNLRIPRQELRSVLLERLCPGTVHWGKRLAGFRVIPGQPKRTKRRRPAAAASSGVEAAGNGAVAGTGMAGISSSGEDGTRRDGGAAQPEEEDSVVVHFTDGSCVDGVAVLVGADGIRSRTRDLLALPLLEPGASQPVPSHASRRRPSESEDPPESEEKEKEAEQDATHYTGVFIVLGISTLRHPLLHEGGFYSVDGTHRLFTMPFRGAEGLTMWQLSFRLPDFRDAQGLLLPPQQQSAVGELLMQEVLRRCEGWHAPVCDMVRCSDPANVWGTPLFDRVPAPDCARYVGAGGGKVRGRGKGGSSAAASVAAERCVALLGDAAHPMTPFKGQGANQALTDAVRLASWLKRAPPPAALKCCAREMVAAATPKVLESRAAAALLHSPRVLPRRLRHGANAGGDSGGDGGRGESVEDSVEDGEGGYGPHGILRFAGVADAHMFALLERLRQRGVRARASSVTDGAAQQDLVAEVRSELEELERELGHSARESKAAFRERRSKKRKGGGGGGPKAAGTGGGGGGGAAAPLT